MPYVGVSSRIPKWSRKAGPSSILSHTATSDRKFLNGHAITATVNTHGTGSVRSRDDTLVRNLGKPGVGLQHAHADLRIGDYLRPLGVGVYLVGEVMSLGLFFFMIYCAATIFCVIMAAKGWVKS